MALLLPATAQALAIKDVSYAALPGDRVQITIKADGPLPQPASFNTDNPPRLAIDFNQVGSDIPKQPVPVGIGLVRSLQTLAAGQRTRLVINLSAAAPYEVSASGNQAVITVSGGTNEGMADAGSRQKASGTVQASPRAQAPGNYGIRNIDFRRGPSGEGKLLISLADAGTVADMQKQGANIVVNIPNTKLPPKLIRKLDVTDFATPAQFITAQPDGSNTQITIEATGIYEHLAYQTDNEYVVELRALTAKEEAQLREKSYTGERLSLNFQDIEVRSVLQLLADFTGMNLVVSDNVTGNITLRLQNVPWDHALDIILKSKNLDMRQKDNVMRIGPAAEIAAAEKLELESKKQVEELAPLVTEWFKLSYAKAEDVAAVLTGTTVTKSSEDTARAATDQGTQSSKNKAAEESSTGSIISPRGSVNRDLRTNVLIVKDTEEALSQVRTIIQRLDVPINQVLIESRLVIADDSFTKDLGVRLGFGSAGASGSVTDPNSTFYSVGGGVPSYSNINNGQLPQAGLNAGQAQTIVRDPITGAPSVRTDQFSLLQDNLLVNLPTDANNPATSAINFVIGKAFSHIISLELSAMQSEGKGELIASPRVLTGDRTQASIKMGEEIPFQIISDGERSVLFKEALLKLDVTPQITPDDDVIMDLIITYDNPDDLRNVDGNPYVYKREVKTQALVSNGETIVLGGVFKQQTNKSKRQTPVLGDLPYFGNLFKQRMTRTANQELLIFVTPRIIKEGLGQIGLRAGRGK
ncbi:type IV pilus secretin PilQ [Magnetovirga frankeli]|nr:type IV pilus secretin PilQ [gamma proteobacterium SS-5]